MDQEVPQPEKVLTVTERIAVKILKGSDLTFFDSFYKKKNSVKGNQKSITLNANVFAKLFYPAVTDNTLGKAVEIPVSVVVIGPQPGKPYRFTRSIARGKTYKNWRLNGAAVPDPEDEIGKFDDLLPEDVAVLEFRGEPTPESVTVIIVSARYDPELRSRLAAIPPGGNRSMAPVSRSELYTLANSLALPLSHPLRHILDDPEVEAILEDAQSGVEPAMRRLRERAGRKVTKQELEAAREKAGRVGADGEALAHLLLSDMHRDGRVTELVWTSDEDAAASWDFEVIEANGARVRLDAKSTTREFGGSSFFLSAAEAVAAANPKIPYRIIRISDLTEDGAIARISTDINELAAQMVRCTEKLPVGVLPTGFNLSANCLKWSEPLPIERPDEPEE